jgi:hypothetical protein
VRSCTEQLQLCNYCTGLSTSVQMGGACVKPNVMHVTLSTRYVREWGTWPARDARTVNPNFVRFKTWDWDCGRELCGLGTDWTEGRVLPSLSLGTLPFPPISSSPPALPLSVPVSLHNSSALAQNVSYPSRTTLLHRGRGGCVAGWLQNCALLIWYSNLIHPHPDNKFEIRIASVIPNTRKLQVASTILRDATENVVHRLQSRDVMSRGRAGRQAGMPPRRGSDREGAGI